MSETIRRMLRQRDDAAKAHEAGLRRELVRRLVTARKDRFVAAFNRQARYYRAGTGRGPKLSVDAAVECEAAHLAMDPGWDAERAWRYAEARDACLAEVEAELERRRGLP